MNLVILRLSFCCFLLCVSKLPVFAQVSLDELSLDGDLELWYDANRGHENLAIYTGMHYPMPGQTVLQHQHYKQLTWLMAEVEYDKQHYSQVEVIYNIYQDQLIIRNKSITNPINQRILLDQNKIGSFTIDDASFVRLKSDLAPSEGAGFYQLLFEGETLRLFAKRYKLQSIHGQGIDYLDRSSIYILKDEVFVKYKGLKSVLKMYPESKSHVKKHAKTNIGNWSNKSEGKLIQLLQFCDQMDQVK